MVHYFAVGIGYLAYSHDDQVMISFEHTDYKWCSIDELKEYDSEDVNNLAIELYDLLSKNKTDESEDLVNQFFNEKYNIINDDSGDEITENKPEDGQVRFSGALQ